MAAVERVGCSEVDGFVKCVCEGQNCNSNLAEATSDWIKMAEMADLTYRADVSYKDEVGSSHFFRSNLVTSTTSGSGLWCYACENGGACKMDPITGEAEQGKLIQCSSEVKFCIRRKCERSHFPDLSFFK